MQAVATAFTSARRYEAAQRLARTGQRLFKRNGQLKNLPGMAGGWTRFRDLRPIPKQSFRDWWRTRQKSAPAKETSTADKGTQESGAKISPNRASTPLTPKPNQPGSAREDILTRIRAALGPAATGASVAHENIARDYQRTGSLQPESTLDLFIDRLIDYDTEVLQIESEADLPDAIAQALEHAGEQRIAVAPEFPSEWLPEGLSIAIDASPGTEALERAQAVITTSEAAVASSGTIILVHGGAQGRRALSLLPDHHICLVRRDRIFEILPQAMAAIQGDAARPITTISGPSATSDIEMTRIRGVHGPRRLTVILYGPA